MLSNARHRSRSHYPVSPVVALPIEVGRERGEIEAPALDVAEVGRLNPIIHALRHGQTFATNRAVLPLS